MGHGPRARGRAGPVLSRSRRGRTLSSGSSFHPPTVPGTLRSLTPLYAPLSSFPTVASSRSPADCERSAMILLRASLVAPPSTAERRVDDHPVDLRREVSCHEAPPDVSGDKVGLPLQRVPVSAASRPPVEDQVPVADREVRRLRLQEFDLAGNLVKRVRDDSAAERALSHWRPSSRRPGSDCQGIRRRSPCCSASAPRGRRR